MSDPPVARERAFALDDGRLVVPEPDVKDALARIGVSTPAAVVVASPAGAGVHASALSEPLVLKAFGPGIVHKRDVGAVQLGLTTADLDDAACAMSAHLTAHGVTPAGFLVEEQCAVPGSIELLLGVVRREPFGVVVALGLGGTLTEALDLVGVRTFPLSERDAHDLLDNFAGARALAGVRGGPPLHRDALVRVLLAIAGPDGLAARLGDELAELECNPVLATPDGAVALDARLVLQVPLRDAGAPRPGTDFTRLFAPRAVVVAGASTSRETFGNRALAAYRAFGWDDGLYALHPAATAVDGVTAARDLTELPEPVDYLLVAVPAEGCAELVRATDGRVPFVHVISGGFDEVGTEGASRSRDLLDAARAAGTRIVGPNCIGVYSPAGRQTFLLNAPHTVGTVSVVSQSGGLAGDVVITGARRGLRFSKVLSAGNAIDITPAEVVHWLVDDADTAVIGLYLEGSSGAIGLVDALHRARGVKPVVVLIGGRSAQGAGAVVSHTGSLTPEPRLWDAVATSTASTVVQTLEALLATLAHLQRWAHAPVGANRGSPGEVLVLGVGGGASVLATDACDRAGLTVAPTSAAVRDALRDMGLGAGTSVANPLEIPFGPAAPVDGLRRVLVPVLAQQPYPDALVHVNVSAYYGYGTEGVRPLVAQLADLAAAPLGDARLAVVLRNLDVAPAADAEMLERAAVDHELVTFATLDEAAIAIAAVACFDDARRSVARST